MARNTQAFASTNDPVVYEGGIFSKLNAGKSSVIIMLANLTIPFTSKLQMQDYKADKGCPMGVGK